jgi:hypothetical protein
MARKKKAKVEEKPSLSLLPGQAITAEDLAMLFEHLTGRKPTGEERQEAAEVLAAGRKAPVKAGKGKKTPRVDQ